MKFTKKILTIVSAAVCCSAMNVNAFAAASTTEEVMPLATGLISSQSLSGVYGYNTLVISATTIGYEEMAEIGIIDIVVQHSSDKTTWVDEVDVADMLNEDAYSFSISDYGVPVISGYYYRVKVTHYAKEQGWFFPDSESIVNYSTAVWIG